MSTSELTTMIGCGDGVAVMEIFNESYDAVLALSLLYRFLLSCLAGFALEKNSSFAFFILNALAPGSCTSSTDVSKEVSRGVISMGAALEALFQVGPLADFWIPRKRSGETALAGITKALEDLITEAGDGMFKCRGAVLLLVLFGEELSDIQYLKGLVSKL